MFLGRFQQGQSLPLILVCENSTGVPTDPTACPDADILNASGTRVSSQALPILDPAASVGLFAGSVYLGSLYPAGLYSVAYRWDISGTRSERLDTFEIVAGGDASGQVLAITNYERPQANFLVQQRQNSTFYKGKNPRL